MAPIRPYRKRNSEILRGIEASVSSRLAQADTLNLVFKLFLDEGLSHPDSRVPKRRRLRGIVVMGLPAPVEFLALRAAGGEWTRAFLASKITHIYCGQVARNNAVSVRLGVSIGAV